MFLKKLCLVGLLSACCVLSAVHAQCEDGTPANMGLCQEFQMIRNLAPHATVITLIQNHMQNDIRFRKAAQYMLSPDFKKTTAKIDVTATFHSFLKPFTNAGVNTTDINGVAKIFDCVIIPDIVEATGASRSSFYSENIPESRSLDTFMQEFSNLIPPVALANLLKKQVAENQQFAKFYGVIRKAKFRSNVMEGFKNRDISRPIKMLRKQQIYLSNLVEYAFNLFNSGPAV